MGIESKSREERIRIAVNLLKDLKQYHIPDSLPGVEKFHKVVRDYTEPNINSGLSGKIKIPEIGRTLEYHLPIRSISQPMVRLKAN